MKNSAASLQGTSFASFIENDFERQNIETLLSSKSGQEGNVGTCNATLTDSLRNRVRVDILFVKVESEMKTCHFLLGIRELREGPCGVTPCFPLPTYKAVKPSQNRGTPTALERSDFSEPPSPATSKGSSRRRHPQMVWTSKNGRIGSLEACLSSWNVSVKRTTCCNYHAYVMAGKKALAQLASSGCDPSFPVLKEDALQCRSCGIIFGPVEDEEDVMCPTCDSRNVRGLPEHTTCSGATGGQTEAAASLMHV
eukprot:TRINITY_DN24379_c0_g1_i1.p1 TRINITY_DN24379_c0_g1~~TRINITY_DN24379_c0_g1_i1.p1  ORF type:complete len:253 (+),score=23.42 TRINITY_DN24379_c0_g1_i1:508-1266(+)